MAWEDILKKDKVFVLKGKRQFYGIFTTKKKAEEYLKMVVSDGEDEEKNMVINEVELDPPSSEPLKVGSFFNI